MYFTGGFAYGGVENRGEANTEGLVVYTNDGTATGYVLGGGYEYKFNPAWSLKAEYQYINLGRNEPTSNGFRISDDLRSRLPTTPSTLSASV